MALIVTLGLLTVICLAIVAFVVSIRIERLAARNALHRTMARQYVDVGLEWAMEVVDVCLVGSRSCYPVQGWFGTDVLDVPPPYPFQNAECLGLPSTNLDPIYLFRGTATNLLPGTLGQQAAQVASGWCSILETNVQTGAEGVRAGRVAFLVVNLSGLPDVHALNAGRRAALGEPADAAWQQLDTNAYRRVFPSQPDLHGANGGPVSNLVTVSYDPGPDVFFAAGITNADGFGTRGFAAALRSRFDLNGATNFNAQPGYASAPSCTVWLAAVSNLLFEAGFPGSDGIAWNALNLLDPGRTPVAPAGTLPFRTGVGVKDVPLINEVALQDVSQPGESNRYGVAVEVWYPFAPRESPAGAVLRVGVYTNAADWTAAVAGFSGAYGTPPPAGGVSFETALPAMNAGAVEFAVGATTNAAGAQQVCFPFVDNSVVPPRTDYLPIGAARQVWIWPQVFVRDAAGVETCVDEALVAADQLLAWTDTGSIQFGDPRANHALAGATNGPVADHTLGATNRNLSVRSLPFVQADGPLAAAAELRHVYAPLAPGGAFDLGSAAGAAALDRFTVRATNAPVPGLLQANTPYTNVWEMLLGEIPVGWTNAAGMGRQWRLDDPLAPLPAGALRQLAGAAAQSMLQPAPDGSVPGWTCLTDMLPALATNLVAAAGATNAVADPAAFSQMQDILAGVAERVSFRQNAFLVIVCGQRVSPPGRVLADQRAAAVILRDAYTGRWVVRSQIWLTE
jgi:hypothetical protein